MGFEARIWGFHNFFWIDFQNEMWYHKYRGISTEAVCRGPAALAFFRYSCSVKIGWKLYFVAVWSKVGGNIRILAPTGVYNLFLKNAFCSYRLSSTGNWYSTRRGPVLFFTSLRLNQVIHKTGPRRVRFQFLLLNGMFYFDLTPDGIWWHTPLQPTSTPCSPLLPLAYHKVIIFSGNLIHLNGKE